MDSLTHRNKLIRNGDTAQSIFVEKDGRYTVADESGEPADGCICFALISNG